ncbi:MAG: hypothetical protein Q4P84_01140, partial [Elusimicrobiales bacterium]|nr:hypothetical protein [Elusimicrobiales bacterium]
MRNFEEYLCDRNDLIANPGYQLICTLTPKEHHGDQREAIETPTWDMKIIGEVNDAVKEILLELVGQTCHLYCDDETPCYL